MKRRISDIYFIFFAVGMLLMALAFLFTKTRIGDLSEFSKREVIEPFKIEQVDEDTRDFYFKPGIIDERNSGLAFFSTHQYVKVYQDRKMVYSLMGDEGCFGDTPGARWNFIDIKPGTKEMRIRIEAVYPRMRNHKITFYQGNNMQISLEILRNSILEALVSILNFSIGMILILYWIGVNRKAVIGRGQLYFGIFAVLVGLWSLLETEMMTILIGNRAAVSFASYMLLMLMCVPFVLFIRTFLNIQNEKFSDFICIASYGSIILCTVLHMAGIYGFKETAQVTHLLFFAALFYLIYALVLWIRKNGMDRVAKVKMLGVAVLVVSFLADMVALYAGARKVDVFGKFGFLFYIALFGWEVAAEAKAKIDEGRKAEIYKELAVKDMLTKVYNRNAYNEWVKINPKPLGTAVVTFDLNNLKMCNDTMGHSAGDEYIQKAAELISKAFGAENSCYRIGGDEFCVVVKNAKPEWIKSTFHELELLEKEYNAVPGAVNLQIACGYAIFDENVDFDIEETRNQADVYMYENKKKLKAQ